MIVKSATSAIVLCLLGRSHALTFRNAIALNSLSHRSSNNVNVMRSEQGMFQDPNLRPNQPYTATTTIHVAKEGNDEYTPSAKIAAISRQSELKSLSLLAAGVLTSLVASAKLGLLGSGYTDALIINDLGITILATLLSLIFVKSITKLAANGYLQPRDSRKIIHTFSSPLYMILWPLFSHNWGARCFAAFVPLIQAVRLWMAGTKTVDDNELANAISRSGAKEEALGGPFIYVIILNACILLSFCDNLSGVIALSTMAAGDGMADILGRRFGKNNKWFFSESKSIAGTLGFILSASACSIGLAAWLIHTNTIMVGMSFSAVVFRILLISAISSIVELLPFADDNWSVPSVAFALAAILIR